MTLPGKTWKIHGDLNEQNLVMQITSTGHNVVKNNFLVYIAFIILSLLLFWPILHKSFVSDDFSILYRVTYEKDFFIRGFFRPLSDISLYSSYLMGGLNPVYYNISNVIIHASCAFLLYRFYDGQGCRFLCMVLRTFISYLPFS